MRPGSGREATEVFVQGSGDVLISYENEAIFTESLGKPIEHVNVPITFKIENPVAVVSESLHVKKATEFKNFLYTPEAQRIWAKTGFRPVDPGSTRTTDPSPRSTKRRPDEYRDRKSHLTGQSGGQGATDGRVRHGRGPFA
ncbi:Probable sulfate ABC transporter, sulfate-binding protein SubI [Mycobacteroides abscessus subsp. massiliense]|nr:Probable sulfate ABC transporter, sulfate-binding protein SubI [Mycobacteroides abscessus subsp. massiliense]